MTPIGLVLVLFVFIGSVAWLTYSFKEQTRNFEKHNNLLKESLEKTSADLKKELELRAQLINDYNKLQMSLTELALENKKLREYIQEKDNEINHLKASQKE